MLPVVLLGLLLALRCCCASFLGVGQQRGMVVSRCAAPQEVPATLLVWDTRPFVYIELVDSFDGRSIPVTYRHVAYDALMKENAIYHQNMREVMAAGAHSTFYVLLPLAYLRASAYAIKVNGVVEASFHCTAVRKRRPSWRGRVQVTESIECRL